MSQLSAVTFFPDPFMTETVKHLRERKWSRRIRFQRERRFDVVAVTARPSREVIVHGGHAFAHPDTIERIREQTNRNDQGGVQ